MKKIISLLLALAMLLALCACGAKEAPETQAPEEEAPAAEEIPEDIMNQPAAPGEGPEGLPMPGLEEDAAEDPTEEVPVGVNLGDQLQSAFLEAAEADPGQSAMDAVSALMGSPALSFGPVTAEVEPGLLTGFGNTEITGFEQGVMFAPMIGSIPFVGYVFRVAADADAQALAGLLEENADPRWNICTEADQTVVAVSGSLVFFVMCPYTLSE